MGRHSSTTAHKPARAKRPAGQTLYTAVLRLWRLLPDEFRRRMWHRRRRWRSWWDHRYARRVARKLRDWTAARDWDASLPKDAGQWADAWDHIGSYAVAAELRRLRTERGDLLPARPRIEPLQEDL
ncbi:hypothetical protein [Nonomuraea sp. GTA35]|uniref:hypothetical protein n=1 Tax=Nonomuraea sp. GTA35 TaxID=1676746 RepID=UPI0035C0F14A